MKEINMPYNKITNEMLYVPFTNEYNVALEIRQKLTTKEFFEHCYVDPDFEKEIRILQNLDNEAINDSEYLLTKAEMINEYQEYISAKDKFIRWFENHESALYCIVGDAGTGKTTYIHFLKFCYSNIAWEIVDIQKAVNPLRWMNQKIVFENFSLLSQKIISTILGNIKNMLYKRDKDGKTDYNTTVYTINYLLCQYHNYVEEYDPDEELAYFFDTLKEINEIDTKKYCSIASDKITTWIKSKFDQIDVNYIEGTNSILRLFISLYIIILHCFNKEHKHILIFDNIERFIGTDEIYNNEIVNFADVLRMTHDSYKNQYMNEDENRDRFAEHYQFIISMRNTSSRMFTPQQHSDALSHTMDISRWFSIDKIIQNKMNWYNENNISIDPTEDIVNILDDIGLSGNTIHGLRPKLELLFNNNKRLIMEFICNVISDINNELFLKKAREYYDNKFGIEPSVARFAYRMIIWKLVMEKLRDDELFRYMCIYDNNNNIFNYGYKILSILSNYNMEHTNIYMSFNELIETLYSHTNNSLDYFFDTNNVLERIKISKLLFNMNYFDRRKGNWLQFIDIQYNPSNINQVSIPTWEKLNEMIDISNTNFNLIKLRITSGGRAYLSYIAQTYELFSTRYFGYPSLVMSIPNCEEINKMETCELEIIKNMDNVKDKVLSFLDEIEDGTVIRLKKNSGDKGHTFKERVMNSQVGYLDNISNCFTKIIYPLPANNSNTIKNSEIITKIREIRDCYRRLKGNE